MSYRKIVVDDDHIKDMSAYFGDMGTTLQGYGGMDTLIRSIRF
jgi:hypothetical protein